jgi:hypothetical protein
MSNLSNYPPGVTGADIEEHFGDADGYTCDECGDPLGCDGDCYNKKCPSNNKEE